MSSFFTKVFSRNSPDKVGTVVNVSTEFNLHEIQTMFDYVFFDKITNAIVEKAVKEIWKKHGINIIKKVDKKTIGNLTVKKLSGMIAKELIGQK